MNLATKRIVIVGGGPGGLTLARLLQKHGANVAVYERDFDRSARVTGSALDLHTDSGLAALAEAGLMDAFWANHRPELNRLRLMNERAEVLYDHARDGEGRPEIERAPLRNLLLDSLAPGTVRWNKKLELAEEAGEQVRLRFSDGESVLADLAVGADGANSRLRALVTPIRPEYAGVTLVEGWVPDAAKAVPEIAGLLGGAALMALGAEQTLGAGTKEDGSVLFYAGLKAPDDGAKGDLERASSPEQRVQWFRRNFPAWSGTWEPLFACTASLVWRPQLVCPAGQHWQARPNVTLLGDAAHVMPPYAGEGVNMAMLDALVLSRELADGGEVHTAVAKYEREMFARMAESSGETMRNTEAFYAPDAAQRIVGMFRSFAARAAGRDAPVPDAVN